jgi:hypothetical protein
MKEMQNHKKNKKIKARTDINLFVFNKMKINDLTCLFSKVKKYVMNSK